MAFQQRSGSGAGGGRKMERKPKGPRGPKGKARAKKKFVAKPVRQLKSVDYKDVAMLTKFLTEKGKILPRKITRLSSKDQQRLTLAIKRARQIALLPYAKS